MKNLIITIGIIIFATFILKYQNDFHQMVREKETLKYIADEAVASAALMINEESYSEGYLIFDDEEVLSKLDEMLSKNLAGKPYKYGVIISDESNNTRKYGEIVDFERISYPYIWLYVDIGEARFSGIQLNKGINAVSVYEYVGFGL